MEVPHRTISSHKPTLTALSSYCRKIDISTATLTYDVENLAKHQFEIMSEGKVTSIQASSNEVMIYWLTALQVRHIEYRVTAL